MLNALAKVYNRMPKKDSKTQQAKKKEKKPEFVKCCKCGASSGVTLRRFGGKWYCTKHFPKGDGGLSGTPSAFSELRCV